MYWYRVWNKTKGEDFTGTNLKEPAAGHEAYTTQIHPSYKGYPSCCPKFDSTPQEFAIPSLSGKLMSNTYSEIQGQRG